MLLGVLAGLTACALWGLTFVAPLAAQPFTVLDITVLRYAAYGVVSALLMLAVPRLRPWRAGVPGRVIALGLVIGALGYVAYFVAAGYAVIFAGPAIPPLVIGLLPVLLAIFGNWHDRSVPWRRLALPLGLILLGTLGVNLETLRVSPDALSARSVTLGLICATAALAIWMMYGIVNSRIMRAAGAPGPLVWTGLQGLGAWFGTLPLLPFTSFLSGEALPAEPSSPAFANFVVWALLLGIVGAWVATWFWVLAARKLSLALSAQLIVAESVFGLLYGFAYVGRWPTVAEAVGAAVQIAGVVVAMHIFAERKKPPSSAPDLQEEVALTGSPR
jgi:drug/metabolite transporter (DMT)-like permease